MATYINESEQRYQENKKKKKENTNDSIGYVNESEQRYKANQISALLGNPTSKEEFDERAKTIAETINTRMQSFTEQYNSFFNDYHDSNAVYNTTKQLKREAGMLNEMLSKYGAIFDDNYVSETSKWLNSMQNGIDKGAEHWLQWKTRDDYDTTLRLNGYFTKYQDMAVEDESKAIEDLQLRYTEASAAGNEKEANLIQEELGYLTVNSKYSQQGWGKYLEDEEASKKAAEAEKEDEKWWETLLRYVSGSDGGGVVDTTLPTAGVTQTVNDLRADDSYKKPTDEWTEGQKNVFGYLYASSPDEAYKYAEELNITINAEKEEKATQGVKDSATSNFWAGLGHSAGAIATAPLGLADYLSDIAMANAGRPITSDGHISPFEYSQAVQSGITENLNEMSGTLNEDIPIIGGKGLGDLYGIGMSAVQSFTSAFTLGAGGALVSYFGQGAAAGVDDALSRGATDAQAILYGAASGTAEAVFELLPIENLIKAKNPDTFRSVIKEIFKQAGIEGLEESGTEIANLVSDSIIMGSNSNLSIAIKEYQDKGYSYELAYKKALGDAVGDIIWAGISGMVSGSVSSSIATNIQAAKNISAGKDINKQGNADAMILAGLDASKESQAYILAEKAFNDYNEKGKVSNMRLGALKQTTMEDVVDQYRNRETLSESDIQAKLESRGIDSTQAAKFASIVVKKANGKKLSERETEALKDNVLAQDVADEILSNQANESFSTLAQLAKIDSLGRKTANETPDTYSVSDVEGKTLVKDSGAEVTIEDIASMDNGKMMLKVNDGAEVKEVNAENISFATNEEAILYEGVAQMDIDAASAKAIIGNFEAKSGITAGQYINGAYEAFRYGKYNFAPEEMSKVGFSADLTEQQKTFAYNLGKNVHITNVDAQESAVKKAIEGAKTDNKTKNDKKGRVRYESTVSALTDRQKASVRSLDIIAKALGVDIYLYESKLDDKGRRAYTNEKGERITANGWYDPKTGDIHIDINAGQNGEGVMLFTAAHELTHFVRQWSPAKFKVLADFLMAEYGKKGVPVAELVRAQMDLARKQGRKISYDTAYEEMIADSMQTMLSDGAVVEKLAKLANKDKSLVEKMKEKLDELVKAIKREYAGMTPYAKEGRYATMLNEAERLQELFYDALVSAGKNYKGAGGKMNIANAEMKLMARELGNDLGNIERTDNGDIALITNKDKSLLLYSARTYEEGGREKLEATLKANGHTQEEINDTLKLVDDAADYLRILAAGYAKQNYGKFGERLSEHLEATVTTDLKGHKQVLSTLVNNGDYPVNLDLALICKKRVAYMRLMNRLIEDGVFGDVVYGGDAIAEVNAILREDGFETACLGCFVESRRLQFQTWAETIVQEWNEAVDAHTKNAGYFGFAKGGKGNLTEADMDAMEAELEGQEKNDKGNVNLGQGSAVTRMNRLLDKVPSLAKKLTVDDLLTPQGLTTLRQADGNLFSIVKSRYGAASPKIVQEFSPYASEIANLTFSYVKKMTGESISGGQGYIRDAQKELAAEKPVKEKGESKEDFKARKKAWDDKVETLAMNNYLFAIGGARIQSFSDFMIENVFDYIQIMADLAAKGSPLHGYTKEIACLRLFGMTGAKWNGSLIAHVDRSMGKEMAGLLPASEAKNGNAILVNTPEGEFAIGFDDYARHMATNKKSFIQSIGMKDIVALMLDPRYSANVGNITIGVSDMQILGMLDSPLFRMVIPYHASGMLPQFAQLVGVDFYNDYTNYQNTTVKQYFDLEGNPIESLKDAKGDVLKPDMSYKYNEKVQEFAKAGVKDAPRQAANDYIAWCAEKHEVWDGKTLVGYATLNPKFSDSPTHVDFSKHKNYYKLLEDFNMYDNNTEAVAMQEAVKMVLPSETNRLNAEQMEAYKQALRDTGIFTEADITKYAKKADMTFEEIIKAEMDNRQAYEEETDPKWDTTVKKVEDHLKKNHPRNGQAKSAEDYANAKGKSSISKIKAVDGSYAIQLAPNEIMRSERDYSYEALTSKPDMKITTVGGTVPNNRADVVVMAKKNAASVGKFHKDGSVSVYVDDIGTEVILATKGLRHGLRRTQDAQNETNYIVTLKAGEILKNSIRINELNPSKENASGSYVLIGTAQNKNGDLYIVQSVINQFNNELDSMDVLYAINAKKELAALNAPRLAAKPLSVTNSTISIAELLDYVNKYFPDVLPESVLRHYQHDRRPEGELGENALYSERDYAPTFYSKMGRVVEDVKQEKLGASSVIPMLTGKGVKAEEIRWSGIHTFLDGKKSVTKQELLDFINGSMLEIGEQMSSNNIDLRYDGSNRTYSLYDESGKVVNTFTYNEFMGGYVSENDDEIYTDSVELEDALREEYGNMSSPRWGDYKLNGGENYREIVFTMPNSSYSNQMMRTHWGEDAEGVLAHARIQDFDVNGKKMLFIEEIQSDWHNAGHKEGYEADITDEERAEFIKLKKDITSLNEQHEKIHNEKMSLDVARFREEKISADEYFEKATVLNSKLEKITAKLNRTINKREKIGDKIRKAAPNAPFSNTYHEFVLKRLLRMAAEQGYDSIGWTTADTQSKRWSDEYAEGYRIEYDQDMPKFLGKYGRQWGAKVEKTSLNKDTEVWSMDITDSMRDSVLYEGQALYSERDPNAVSNRSLLANALENAATNDIEKNKLKQYKEKIDFINAEERKLADLNRQLKELRFSKGKRDTIKTKQINDLQAEATKTANRISIYDKQLLNLEASTPLKNVLEREKAKARKLQKQRDAEFLQEQKDKANATIREIMNRHTESRKKATEGRHKTVVRNKIKRVIKDLNSVFNRGTKERNVKIGLRDTVRKALEASEVLFSDEITNEDIVRLGVDSVSEQDSEKLERYATLLALRDTKTDALEISRINSQISRLNSDLKDVFIRERARLNRENVSSALDSLAEAYASLQNSDDDYIKNNAFVQGMHDRIKSLSENLNGVTIKDMSLEQLEDVYKIYSSVRHMIVNANSIFRDGLREDLSKKIMTVQGEILELQKDNKKDPSVIFDAINNAIKSFDWNNQKPVYAFEKLGSKAFQELFWDAIKAEGLYAQDVKEAGDFLDTQKDKFKYADWDFKKAKTFKSANGLDFKLTLADMMSIYAYSKRPQAFDHMTQGGFTFDRGSTYVDEKGRKRKHVRLSETYTVSIELINEIVRTLSEEQIGYVDAVQAYLTSLGEKGNEVSRTLYGIDLFTEKVYFPLKSDADYRSSVEQALNETQTQVSLKNTGMTKQTVPHANNPIVLQGFDDVVLGHVDNMSKYHSFVLPIENLRRVFDNVSRDENASYDATKVIIESVFGESAKQYFDQYITDLNGGVHIGGYQNIFMDMFSKMKKTAVSASLSVVVQQPFAITRAMDMINPVCFTPVNFNAAKKNTDSKSQWEELKKYAPIAIIKEMGGFDVGSSRTTRDYIGGKKSLDDFFMWGASKADEIGWSTIWKAVKREVASQHKELAVGSEAFLKKCGERFTEVVVYTQVYDSVNSRSGMMRSKRDLDKFATSFMGEPTTTINMIENSMLKLARAVKSKDGKAIAKATAKMGRTTGVVLGSILLTSLAKSLVYAGRDDDEEDKALLERWAKHFGDSLTADLNPLTMIPYLRDFVSIWEGWDVERPDMTVVADIVTSIKKAIDEGCTVEEALALIGNAGNAFGLPVKNIIREVQGAINVFNDITDDIEPTDIGGAFMEGWTGEEKSKKDSLYQAIVSGDEGRIAVLRGEYKTEDAYEQAIRKGLRENDPRIREAAQARIDGDIAKYSAIVREIKAEGHFVQDTIVAAVNAEINLINKEAKEQNASGNDEIEDTEEKATSIYKASDINAAFDNGDTNTALAIIEDLVSTKVANGMTEKEAKSSVKSSMTSYWKPIFLEAYTNKDTNEQKRIRQILLASGLYGKTSEVIDTTQQWIKDSKKK